MTADWEPRPVPDVTPETAPFWAGCADGELKLMRCRDCELVYFYPRARCPDCFSAETAWIEAAGTGTVYSYATMERMDDWPASELPLVLAYVDLAEGPRVMTNLVECDPEDVTVGMPVAVQFVPTESEDIAIPVFVPAAERGDATES